MKIRFNKITYAGMLVIAALVLYFNPFGIDSILNNGSLKQVVDEVKTAKKDLESLYEEDMGQFFETGEVTQVIDGDTLLVRIDGVEQKVRLIGIDAPESVHLDASKNTVEGIKASDYMKTLVPEKTMVCLQKDTSETDEYNRLLRYVWLNVPTNVTDEEQVQNAMLNAILVKDGYAQAKAYEPDTAYAEIFGELEKDAVANHRGVSHLWAEG